MARSNPSRLRAVAAVVLPVAVGVAGAWLGMLGWGRATTSMGPFQVELASRFGRGVTEVNLAPLGRLTADTHLAPLRLTVSLLDVRIPELTETLRRSGPEALAAQVEVDALEAVLPFALRLLAVAAAGALVLALLAFRRAWRSVLLAVLVAVAAVGGSETALWRTYRPAALLTPTFSGSLALAPRLIGPARTALGRIEAFRAELEAIVRGAARVYASIESRPALSGSEVRVLHISDVHLSPLGLQFAREVAEAFDVAFVVDTGDLTSFGTPAEDLILRFMAGFRRPYVFVRGNHDSPGLTDAMRRVPNVVVLDGQAREVAGLVVYGRGHPVFTPDRQNPVEDERFAELARASGQQIAADLALLDRPPDIVAVHDDRMAEPVAGRVPLVISGHFHQPSARVVDGTVFLRVGSTGGSGAGVFAREGGIPLSAEVLYFDAATRALIAYDLIEQSPETGSLQVSRHLAEELVPEGAAPSPSPSPTPSPGGTGSPSPAPT